MSDEKKYGARTGAGIRGPQRGPLRRATAADGANATGRRARVGEASYAPAEGGGEQLAPRIRRKRTGRTPLRKIHAKKNKAPDSLAAKAVAERAAAAHAAVASGELDSKVAAQGGLDGKQRRYLRGLGHELNAILHVGKEGTTEGVVAACAKALHQHELVKAKILQECPEDRHAVGEALAAGTGAALVQILGRTVLLYKRHPKEPKIRLPG